MKIRILAFALLLAVPRAASPQTTVFDDTFSNGSTINSTPASPTANSTTYEEIASKKYSATPTIATTNLTWGLASTMGGGGEIQALFTTSPVTLQTVGEYIKLTVTFTPTEGFLTNQWGMGLFNAHQVAPWSGGIDNTGGNFDSESNADFGGVQDWVGTIAQFGSSDETPPTLKSEFADRPVQGAITSNNCDQVTEVTGSTDYGYTNATTHNSSTSYNVPFALNTQYTEVLNYLLTNNGALLITASFYAVGSPSDTLISSMAYTSAAPLTTTFDAFSMGFRSEDNESTTALRLNSVQIVTTAPYSGPATCINEVVSPSSLAVSQTNGAVAVTIPSGTTRAGPLSVSLVSSEPTVAYPYGAPGGTLTLTFSQNSGYNTTNVPIIAAESGSTDFYITNATEDACIDEEASTSLVTVATQTQTNANAILDYEPFNTEASALADGWDGNGNQANEQNFGFSATSNAGGTAGEAGGVTVRNTVRAAYGNEFGPAYGYLTLNDTLTCTGRVAGLGANGSTGLFIGWYNTTNVATDTVGNTFGLLLSGSGTSPSAAQPIRCDLSCEFSNNTHTDFQTGFYYLTNGNQYYWDYTWNPSGGVSNVGQIVINIYNTNHIRLSQASVSFTATERNLGAEFNAFGLITRDLSANSGVFETNDVDELYYTALPDTLCQATLSPAAISMFLNSSTNVLTVAIPNALNASAPISVNIVSTNPGVAMASGAVGGTLTITFPAGGYDTTNVPIDSFNVGTTLFYITNITDGGCISESNYSSTVQVESLVPTVDFAAASGGGAERATLANLVVNLSEASAQTVMVEYAVTGGTATNGVAYTLSTGTLTFNPGQTNQTLAIPIINDSDPNEETVVVTLESVWEVPSVNIASSGSGAVVLSWPMAFTNYQLQATSNLAASVWANATNAVVISNSLCQVTLAPESQASYSRLVGAAGAALAGAGGVALGGQTNYTYTIYGPYGPTFTNSLGMVFVQIAPGAFTMGAGTNPLLGDTGTLTFDEQPTHPVTLTQPFDLLQDTVTQAQYEQSGLPGSATDVSWTQAAAFCTWLSQHEGRNYRLPTEAEWEYCMKVPQSAAMGITFPGCEWMNDWHQIYLIDSLTDPVGPLDGILKVIRADATNRESLPPDATSSPWGLPTTGFRVVLDYDPATNTNVTPRPFNQSAVKQSTAPALQGPAPNVPYFTCRFALPIPPSNDGVDTQNGPLTGVDQGVVDHNHSPGFEVMPNGDTLVIYFSGVDGNETGPEVRIVQARLRYGAEEFDMPETLYKVKDYNDESPLQWREGTTNWLFVGGLMGLNYLPFKVCVSTNSGATWAMHLPILTGSPNFSDITAQPITTAFRAPGGAMYFGMDGGGTDSLLWRSLDNGTTWNDQGGRTGGRHSTILPLDTNGDLISYGGKNSNVNGWMPMQTSSNWGVTWSGMSQSPFPALSSNQRPSLWRLADGDLVLVGDAQDHSGNQPSGWTNGYGVYVAISTNNASTWYIKMLPVGLPHCSDGLPYWTLGYAVVRQAPNGVIHVITSMTVPCIHYEFNEAWVFSTNGDIPPETTGGTNYQYSENYPDGALKATWGAEICPHGRYLLNGVETNYYENGQLERVVTWVDGRRTGTETYWGPDGVIRQTWEHNLAANTSTWIHWYSNGRMRMESTWNTNPRPPSPSTLTNNFRGMEASGPAYGWNLDGSPEFAYSFTNDGLTTNKIALPPPQP